MVSDEFCIHKAKIEIASFTRESRLSKFQNNPCEQAIPLELLNQMVNGQPSRREEERYQTYCLRIFGYPSDSRIVLNLMVLGITILGVFACQHSHLGKKNRGFLACSGLGVQTAPHNTVSAYNPGWEYPGRTVFHFSLIIHITLVSGQKCNVLVYSEKYLTYKQLHLCSKVLLSTTYLAMQRNTP